MGNSLYPSLRRRFGQPDAVGDVALPLSLHSLQRSDRGAYIPMGVKAKQVLPLQVLLKFNTHYLG